MSKNREVLAKNIANRFIDAISGNKIDKWINENPEDRIYVGKLSPQSQEADFSSSVLIKQISVEFNIPKKDIDKAELLIYPQGNFFYRILPTFEQQKKFFVDDFNAVFDKKYKSFDELLNEYNGGLFTEAMKEHKVELVPIYEKIAIDRKEVYFNIKVSNFYNKQFDCGSVPADDKLYKSIKEDVLALHNDILVQGNALKCQYKDKSTISDLINEKAWLAYRKKQEKREDVNMLPQFNYSIAVTFTGNEENLLVVVALSNETNFGDETLGYNTNQDKKDKYRINTLFNSGIKVKCVNTIFSPIELDYFEDDYKYDKNVYALGNSCNVIYDETNSEIKTTHVPVYIQHRLKTKNELAVEFDDLIDNPIRILKSIHTKMLSTHKKWTEDFGNRTLSKKAAEQFKKEIDEFETEIKRFYTGIELIEKYNIIKEAFCCMNKSFKKSAKGYSSWRLFQIVFIVSLILDIVANEKDLGLDDDLVRKAKTDFVDILYFPTGGGKTEAFLGILVFNLFFDRLRGKEVGVTAMLKYPLRLLSVQQVQRVSNILASAELIRLEQDLEGEPFSLGYYVGEGNTPNSINDEQKAILLELSSDQLDEKYRLLDVCPYCGRNTVKVKYNVERNSLEHNCDNPSCKSGGIIPLYMIDEDIYRYLPSVIISTVDKLAAIGVNQRFHNLICGAEFKCPKHGYTDRTKCLVKNCDCDPADFIRVKMKDPAPTLLIQDELHLIKESLGTYASHYETFFEYFVKNLSGCNRGIKVIGATATISAYQEQAWHLYYKDSIRFPSASPYLNENFYSYVDDNDICRIIFGYAPFGKAIVNSVAYSLQYLKRVIWHLYMHPELVLGFDGYVPEGVNYDEQLAEAKKLLEDYWIILEYNNVKMESNKVLNALEDPINTELNQEGVQTLIPKKMTGDETFQDVRSALSAIENTKNVIDDMEFNMIAATSMISHGVDADRFNLMMFYGIPGNTAEYIQAYSRVGRKYPGIVIDIMRPAREKDQSYLKNFNKFHEYKDILVDSVSINRWATKAVELTLPGIIAGLLLNYYSYKLKYTEGAKDISKFGDLRFAFNSGLITADILKEHAYKIYKCANDDRAIGVLYREKINELIDKIVDNIKNNSFEPQTYLTEAFSKSYFYVMKSLRDTDTQILVKVD